MLASSLFLQALFEPLVHGDGAAVEAVLSSLAVLPSDKQEALRAYVRDPIGVRSWALTERAFFTGERFPFVSPRAMLRLREARAAAAYGLRDEACEALLPSLRMPAERLDQVTRALQIYENGIKQAFAEPRTEPLVEPSIESVEPATPEAPAVAAPEAAEAATAPPAVAPTTPAPPAAKVAAASKKKAKPQAKPAKAAPAKPKKLSPTPTRRSKGRSGSASP